MEGHISARESNRTTLAHELVAPPEDKMISWPRSFSVVFCSQFPVFLSILANVFSTTMTISFISGQFEGKEDVKGEEPIDK